MGRSSPAGGERFRSRARVPHPPAGMKGPTARTRFPFTARAVGCPSSAYQGLSHRSSSPGRVLLLLCSLWGMTAWPSLPSAPSSYQWRTAPTTPTHAQAPSGSCKSRQANGAECTLLRAPLPTLAVGGLSLPRVSGSNGGAPRFEGRVWLWGSVVRVSRRQALRRFRKAKPVH